jgi:hypothetical protein
MMITSIWEMVNEMKCDMWKLKCEMTKYMWIWPDEMNTEICVSVWSYAVCYEQQMVNKWKAKCKMKKEMWNKMMYENDQVKMAMNICFEQSDGQWDEINVKWSYEMKTWEWYVQVKCKMMCENDLV